MPKIRRILSNWNAILIFFYLGFALIPRKELAMCVSATLTWWKIQAFSSNRNKIIIHTAWRCRDLCGDTHTAHNHIGFCAATCNRILKIKFSHFRCVIIGAMCVPKTYIYILRVWEMKCACVRNIPNRSHCAANAAHQISVAFYSVMCIEFDTIELRIHSKFILFEKTLELIWVLLCIALNARDCSPFPGLAGFEEKQADEKKQYIRPSDTSVQFIRIHRSIHCSDCDQLL